ncbi:hypothetical protein FCR2A7T_07370 [Flavobacterium cauense R2A-7]|nr:hypothetical protein FCR2A7T_07370 [Flavobacterium cauense R2A-7]
MKRLLSLKNASLKKIFLKNNTIKQSLIFQDQLCLPLL